MKFWFYGYVSVGVWGWKEISEDTFCEANRCLDYWMKRDGRLPAFLEGCKVMQNPNDPTATEKVKSECR